jgi:hypothetical protein
MPDIVEWLLEEDDKHPGVRYFTLVDLLDRPTGDPDVVDARQALMRQGQVPAILEAQDPTGYWEKPGTGYHPKYRGSVWSVIYLAQLGADPTDPRVRSGGEYLLSNAMTEAGTFSITGTPSGNISCLNGNLCAALLDLGFGDDERLLQAVERMARFVTGDGIATATDRKEPLRYLKSATCGPGFRCSANNRLPCAWGAVKVLRALARVPEEARTPVMEQALSHSVEFLFSVDPASAGYPAGYSHKPSTSWFKLGFPLFYVTDVLQTAEALTEAGHGGDPRLAATYQWIASRRELDGRWKMTYSYQGKTWADAGKRGEPNKWVALRAMRVLRRGGVEL